MELGTFWDDKYIHSAVWSVQSKCSTRAERQVLRRKGDCKCPNSHQMNNFKGFWP
jgi:hypothetical protein